MEDQQKPSDQANPTSVEGEQTPAPVYIDESKQIGLFGDGELPAAVAAPEPVQSIYVHFEDMAGIEAFGKLIGQPVTTQTRLIKFPIDPNHFRAWMGQNAHE